MAVKALHVCVDLDIQAVSCPGVWLCPNGKVHLAIYTLNSSAKSRNLLPIFPLLFHEQFVLCKTFSAAGSLTALAKCLASESFRISLIQSTNQDNVVKLATFRSSLLRILFPNPSNYARIVGTDIDLLMKATKQFPGIIAPKIEISTKTVIEETLKSCSIPNLAPKTLPSQDALAQRSEKRLQRKVCHTSSYHSKKHKQVRNKSTLNNNRKSNYIPPLYPLRSDQPKSKEKAGKIKSLRSCKDDTAEGIYEKYFKEDNACPLYNAKKYQPKGILKHGSTAELLYFQPGEESVLRKEAIASSSVPEKTASKKKQVKTSSCSKSLNSKKQSGKSIFQNLKIYCAVCSPESQKLQPKSILKPFKKDFSQNCDYKCFREGMRCEYCLRKITPPSTQEELPPSNGAPNDWLCYSCKNCVGYTSEEVRSDY